MTNENFINAGHDRDHGGARYDSLSEAKLNMKIRDIVVKQLPDLQSVPDDLNFSESIKWVNDRVSVICAPVNNFAVSIHLNKNDNSNIRGVEVYYDGDTKDDPFIAEFFAKTIAKHTGLTLRGAKHQSESFIGSLGWLTKLHCPSVLIEVCYPSNNFDRHFITHPDGQRKAGKAIARAIRNYNTAVAYAGRVGLSFEGLLNTLYKFR